MDDGASEDSQKDISTRPQCQMKLEFERQTNGSRDSRAVLSRLTETMTINAQDEVRRGPGYGLQSTKARAAMGGFAQREFSFEATRLRRW
ncbi:hypothetical protein RRF57_009193 [Xylaria bambusicola]|uniref:Uncharacterized protein n=1 Tax=Xylaria bambusicola TaxID=326684 RepID=A0AAN7UZ41_9PEZI